MRDKVARVRRLLEEATTAKQSATAVGETAAFTTPSTAPPPHYAEQTFRARTKREIHRIASWYGWSAEIDRALDAAAATSTARLNDDQLSRLLARMQQLEECVQNATDCPDAPPAR